MAKKKTTVPAVVVLIHGERRVAAALHLALEHSAAPGVIETKVIGPTEPHVATRPAEGALIVSLQVVALEEGVELPASVPVRVAVPAGAPALQVRAGGQYSNIVCPVDPGEERIYQVNEGDGLRLEIAESFPSAPVQP